MAMEDGRRAAAAARGEEDRISMSSEEELRALRSQLPPPGLILEAVSHRQKL